MEGQLAALLDVRAEVGVIVDLKPHLLKRIEREISEDPGANRFREHRRRLFCIANGESPVAAELEEPPRRRLTLRNIEDRMWRPYEPA